MRPIKFRGKTHSGVWVYGYYEYQEFAMPHIIRQEGCAFEVIPETIGQFTGMLDKNGIEIYEGDIVKIFKHEIPGIIKWDNHRLCFLCEWTNMPTAGDIEYLVNNCLLEVVGTVFDILK